jgi:hypothetical protein
MMFACPRRFYRTPAYIHSAGAQDANGRELARQVERSADRMRAAHPGRFEPVTFASGAMFANVETAGRLFLKGLRRIAADNEDNHWCVARPFVP